MTVPDSSRSLASFTLSSPFSPFGESHPVPRSIISSKTFRCTSISGTKLWRFAPSVIISHSRKKELPLSPFGESHPVTRAVTSYLVLSAQATSPWCLFYHWKTFGLQKRREWSMNTVGEIEKWNTKLLFSTAGVLPCPLSSSNTQEYEKYQGIWPRQKNRLGNVLDRNQREIMKSET